MALRAACLRRSLLAPGAQALAERLAAAGWQCAGELVLGGSGTSGGAGTAAADTRDRGALRPPWLLPTSTRGAPAGRRSPFDWPGRHFHTTPGLLGNSTSKGSSSRKDSSSSSSDSLSALQRALAAEGVADWAAYDTPAFSAWASRADPAQLAVKVAELSREGLAAGDVERLFQQKSSPIHCDLEAVFRPNLAYLRALLAGVPNVPKRREPARLTVLGRLLRDQPSIMSEVLSRDPTKVQALDRWVCGELGVRREELSGAVAKSPVILRLSVESGRAVAGFLSGELGLSHQHVVRMLLRQPGCFGCEPDTLRAKLGKLKATLKIEDGKVAELVVREPLLLASSLDNLPAVLSDLDSFFGRKRAGAELVLRDPILATLTPARLSRSLAGLRGLLGSEAAVQEAVASRPALLIKDVAGPDQRQKLEWNDATLRLPLARLLGGDIFNRDLRRMAGRLAFLRHLGLPDPASLDLLGRPPTHEFLETAGKRAGRVVTAAEFEAFVAAWLETPEGRRWGFKPEKRRAPKAD